MIVTDVDSVVLIYQENEDPVVRVGVPLDNGDCYAVDQGSNLGIPVDIARELAKKLKATYECQITIVKPENPSDGAISNNFSIDHAKLIITNLNAVDQVEEFTLTERRDAVVQHGIKRIDAIKSHLKRQQR